MGDWFGLFLAAILPIHYTLASMNLRTLAAKNVWTGLLSTLAPICFVAKDKIKDHNCKLFCYLQCGWFDPKIVYLIFQVMEMNSMPITFGTV